MPAHWPGFEMRYHFGTATYEIAVRAAASAGAAGVSVDAVALRDGVIALVDDGKRHAVVVDAWRERGPLAA